MNAEYRIMFGVLTIYLLTASGEAFFLRWGSETSQSTAPKTWIQQPVQPIPHMYRTYNYSPYDQRKLYQTYQPESLQSVASTNSIQSMQSIPISVPLQASLTPVALQHVQLVPCMCPVAPEEADKLQESVGPGPYLAQTSYTPGQPQAYVQVPQQMGAQVQNEQQKNNVKQ